MIEMDLIKIAEQAFAGEQKTFPVFKAGDTITVTYRIKEENKERLQKFRGVCIQRKGTGSTQTFTVRKVSSSIGVERIFPITSPFIESIELNKSGKVRRARIFYLRNLTGKKARIKEKKRNFIADVLNTEEAGSKSE
jgi:large subunit ribosomal protein L19